MIPPYLAKPGSLEAILPGGKSRKSGGILNFDLYAFQKVRESAKQKVRKSRGKVRESMSWVTFYTGGTLLLALAAQQVGGHPLSGGYVIHAQVVDNKLGAISYLGECNPHTSCQEDGGHFIPGGMLCKSWGQSRSWGGRQSSRKQVSKNRAI